MSSPWGRGRCSSASRLASPSWCWPCSSPDGCSLIGAVVSSIVVSSADAFRRARQATVSECHPTLWTCDACRRVEGPRVVGARTCARCERQCGVAPWVATRATHGVIRRSRRSPLLPSGSCRGCDVVADPQATVPDTHMNWAVVRLANPRTVSLAPYRDCASDELRSTPTFQRAARERRRTSCTRRCRTMPGSTSVSTGRPDSRCQGSTLL